jgi:hypothetical protein
MTMGTLAVRAGRTLAFATAFVGAAALTAAPRSAHALGTGAAVGIGLGALAVGTALGAAGNPYYGYPGYGYGYAPSYYYPPAPAYSYYPAPGYPVGQCWSGYYGRYVPC